MKILPTLRRTAILLAIVAIVAGCATPQESGPRDLNCDGDRDGVPDGQSPVEGTNSTCPTNTTLPDTMTNETS